MIKNIKQNVMPLHVNTNDILKKISLSKFIISQGEDKNFDDVSVLYDKSVFLCPAGVSYC